MKFLIIVQDLRITGTSEGIVSRSFLGKLRSVFPNAYIEVLYLKNHDNEDDLNLLPIDSIRDFHINRTIPFFTKWINKIYWRLFHESLNEKKIQERYATVMATADFEKFDHIFIRSSGLDYETILAAKKLPVLKNAIINFHDPFPVFWDTGSRKKLTAIELFRLKNMWEIVQQAKVCITPALLLSEDLEHLYGSEKKFYTLPHQYDKKVFNLSSTDKVRQKNKPVTISYHGAIQLGRNIDIVLDAYQELIANSIFHKENTEFVLRLRGSQNQRLKNKYQETANIIILDTLDFANSCNEQSNETDILIILENSSPHSNILGGKAPFLASLHKPILIIAPNRSEMRRIVSDNQFIADCRNKEEIREKLKNLIDKRIANPASQFPFGDYFEEQNFKESLLRILEVAK
ncbi:hypothetical protein [Flavobacterium kingsejongi]|uniref:Glycosyl transferase family 1 n=1 Tax=Flavobacterium kingsejongi TaxID=1678728 RepID=A0A2S1LNS3_9FLAO|nr:hypothetical protein [Flavobacterium kingsejongi]AWG25384.1 hypothetical protein FK004_09100 [Flavobacterium kingsejongi]